MSESEIYQEGHKSGYVSGYNDGLEYGNDERIILREEIERLRSVLKPFAELRIPDYPDDMVVFGDATLGSSTYSAITFSHLRAATAALKESENE